MGLLQWPHRWFLALQCDAARTATAGRQLVAAVCREHKLGGVRMSVYSDLGEVVAFYSNPAKQGD